MNKFKIILVVILLLLVGLGYYLTAGYFSKGIRSGTLSKLSERGYVFKTYEGVLNEGGYSGETGTLTPRYWDFSCKLDTVITKLELASKTGERITLHYQEKFFQFPWNGDTKYFITNVEFLAKPTPPITTFPTPEPALPPVKIDSIKADSTL